MSQLKPGVEVGPWTLEQKLGDGGNADVWEASRDGETRALKLLRKFKGEPYERFLREVRTQLECADDPGVLPIVDSHLPDAPSSVDRPWYSMPICETADSALVEAGLEEVVSAVASIAETLGRLHERGISHRDIKPGNLYRHEGTWRVGDFGLVDLPDESSLTITGRPLGPRHFMPPELLAASAVDDSRPADVFMLAKTLWVLATGQKFPFPGEQRADVEPYRLRTWLHFRRTAALDELVDRCTRAVPEERPSMVQVAADLHAWLTLVNDQDPAERAADETFERLGRAVGPRLTRQQQEEKLRERFTELMDLSDDLLSDLASRLATHAGAEHVYYDATTDKYLRLHDVGPGPRAVEHRSPCLRVSSGGSKPLVLGIGRYFALGNDDNFYLGAVLYLDLEVGREIFSQEHHRIKKRGAPCDSIAAEQVVREITGEIISAAPEWIDLFASRVESR